MPNEQVLPEDIEILPGDIETSCPECGSNDFASWEYDFGMSMETGYHDCGMRCKCRNCGHEEDADGFVRKVRHAA